MILLKKILWLVIIISMVSFVWTLKKDEKEKCKSSNTVEGDPMVKITSLPIKQDLDEILPPISKEISEMTGLPEGFLTYYWSFFETIYCPGCDGVGIKKPIFIDLYVPGFMSKEDIKTVMTSIAQAIENNTDYTKKDLFIHIINLTL